MASEKSGFNITVSCTQDSTIVFACKAKKRPGVQISGKIDMTTDASAGCKVFEPGNLLEVTDGKLTVLDDPVIAAKIIAILGRKGTITFTGKTTGQSVSYTNAWFSSYVPADAGLDTEAPSAVVTIQSSGTLPS